MSGLPRATACSTSVPRHLHVVAQPLGVALLADLGAHARHQLVLVDRSSQVVVDADLEPAHELCIVLGVCDREDWHVARPFERTHLATQTQAVEIVERERHDQQVVVALGGVKECFVRVRLDLHPMFAVEHPEEALRRGGPVVNHQDRATSAGISQRLPLRTLDPDLA